MVSTMRLIPLVAAVCAALWLGACSHQNAPAPEPTFSMGEKVPLGHIVYTVFETRWATQFPLEPTPRLPEHRFFMIRISAVNNGTTDALIPSTTLLDDHGNTYSELNKGDGAPQWIGYLRQAKASAALQGNLLFDVPPQHYKLRVTDETGERAALIDIPFSFNTEAPDVAIPPPDKK